MPLLSQETHIIRKGETLYSISRSYGISVDELCRINGIKNSSAVNAGQKLYIPSVNGTVSSGQSDTYTVKRGDTLFSLARSFNVTLDELRNYNGLSSSDVLKEGQMLRIPAAKSITSAGAQPELPDISGIRSAVGKKGDPSLIWPVKASDVYYLDGKISGVQLSASANEPVNAIASGTVMYSGLYRGFGEVVFVRSNSNYIYVYTGLGNTSISKGAHVSAGTTLGRAGIDSISGKPRMTLMVFKNGNPVDPAKAPRG